MVIAYCDVRIAFELDGTDIKQFGVIYQEVAKRLRELNPISHTITVPVQNPQPTPQQQVQELQQEPQVEEQSLDEEVEQEA